MVVHPFLLCFLVRGRFIVDLLVPHRVEVVALWTV